MLMENISQKIYLLLYSLYDQYFSRWHSYLTRRGTLTHPGWVKVSVNTLKQKNIYRNRRFIFIISDALTN
jgi:hypothetical protein